MSTLTLSEVSTPGQYPFGECRVWERFPCGLHTICQPVAGRGDMEMSWSAQIRDLSEGGVGVVLRRRFERGVGLAIEIPESESSSTTMLMGRVVHTTSLPGGLWLHGCAFVSPLSEDELQRLLRLGQMDSNLAPQETAPAQVIEEVTLVEAANQEPHRRIRHLHVKGTWPPAPGKIFKVWFGNTPQAYALLRVERCVQEAGQWFLYYTFFASPSPEIRQAFANQD